MDIYAMGYRGTDPENVCRVTAAHRNRFELMGRDGAALGILKGQWPVLPTVGDFVRARPLPGGEMLMEALLPRRTLFERRDPTVGRDRGAQAVAANMDYVFIMTSLNRDFRVERLERYLTLTRQSGAEPVILLTKKDICPDPGPWAAQAEGLGARVHCVSAVTGEGMDELAAYLRPGITAALLGSSGVGKSSLVNYLMGEDVMRTHATRSVDASKGSHTTTYRQLLFLPGGAMLMDTPGMREMGMWDVSTGLGEAFPEIEALEKACRFRNCGHQSEPGCAVRRALEAGDISPKRLGQYLALKREARYSGSAGETERKKQEEKSALTRAMRRERAGRGK